MIRIDLTHCFILVNTSDNSQFGILAPYHNGKVDFAVMCLSFFFSMCFVVDFCF